MIIKLSNGQEAIIDDADYPLIADWKWHVQPRRRTFYAVAAKRIIGAVIRCRMHRLIMQAAPDQVVDHINGNGLDNRRGNLRFATHSLNAANRSNPRKGGFRGVYPRGDKFSAVLTYRKETFRLGIFDSEIEAAQAYDAAAKKHFGEFARLNLSEAT